MPNKLETYCCRHCGTPMQGRVIGMIHGAKVVREMCKDCEAYIGSEAARLPGATMKNRREMEAKWKKLELEAGATDRRSSVT